MTKKPVPANLVSGLSYATERSSSSPGNHISHRLGVLFRLLGHVLLRLYGLCLIGRLVLDHAVTNVYQFSRGRTGGARLGLVCRQQPLIKRLNIRVLARGHHGWEEEFLPVVSTA